MCMVDWDHDAPTVSSTHMRVSRKVRRCSECDRSIAVGESYQNCFMVYDSSPDTFTTCAHCVVAMRWLARNCGGYLFEGVWDDIREHISEYPTLRFSLSRLVVGMRSSWMRFDKTGLMAVPKVPQTLEEAGLEPPS